MPPRSFLFQSPFHPRNKDMQRVRPNDLMPQCSVRQYHQESRISMYIIFFSERYPFPLFRINLETHEIIIEILGSLRRLQYLLAHPATRSAPRRTNIHENHFLLLLRHIQSLLKTSLHKFHPLLGESIHRKQKNQYNQYNLIHNLIF